MEEAKCYCYRCGTTSTVLVTEEDKKNRVGYDECPGCGKSGKFDLVDEDDDAPPQA